MFGLICTRYFMTMDNPSTLSAKIAFYIHEYIIHIVQRIYKLCMNLRKSRAGNYCNLLYWKILMAKKSRSNYIV